MIWEVAAVMQAQVHEADHSHTVVAKSPLPGTEATLGFSLRHIICLWSSVLPLKAVGA